VRDGILTNYRRDPPPNLANIKFTERADQLLKGVATEKEQRNNNTIRYTVKKVNQVPFEGLIMDS
jgi:hypothetical protein